MNLFNPQPLNNNNTYFLFVAVFVYLFTVTLDVVERTEKALSLCSPDFFGGCTLERNGLVWDYVSFRVSLIPEGISTVYRQQKKTHSRFIYLVYFHFAEIPLLSQIQLPFVTMSDVFSDTRSTISSTKTKSPCSREPRKVCC